MFGKRLIITISAIIIIIVVKGVVSYRSPYDSDYYFIKKDTLNCAIILEDDMYSSKGRPIGFHYEMLRLLGDYTNTNVVIESKENIQTIWDKLIVGEYDILVVSDNDSIPPKYKEELLFSVPIRENFSWVVSTNEGNILNSINFWFAEFQKDKHYKRVTNRYFRSYRIQPHIEGNSQATALSPYDDIIKKYSTYFGIDWRLLSSVIYQESRYSIGASSHRNAQGLMQIKRSTAKSYGIDDIFDPELNVKAGTLHIEYLLNIFRKEGLDSTNVIKFALGSYNAGEGRIQECRQAAAKLGLNPNDWEEVTQSFESMNNFSGKETIRYVNEVIERFEQYKVVIN